MKGRDGVHMKARDRVHMTAHDPPSIVVPSGTLIVFFLSTTPASALYTSHICSTSPPSAISPRFCPARLGRAEHNQGAASTWRYVEMASS